MQSSGVTLSQIQNYISQLQKGTSGDCNKEAIAPAIRQLYEALGHGPPEIIWCASPTQFTNMPQLHAALAKLENSNAVSRAALVRRYKRSGKKLKIAGASEFWTDIEKYCARQSTDLRPPETLLSSAITVNIVRSLMSRLSEQAEEKLGLHARQLIESQFRAQFSKPSPAMLKDLCERLGAHSYSRDLAYEPAVVSASGTSAVNDGATSEQAVSLRPYTIFLANRAWGIWDVLPAMTFDCMRAAVTDQALFAQTENALLDIWVGLFKAACAYLFFENLCYVCPYPLRQSLDDFGRLHGSTGPAAEFSDGQKMYYWQGRPINEDLITRKFLITPISIDLQSNVEKRRIMMEIYGFEKYLRHAGAKKVHKDEYGTLYKRRPWLDRDPIVAVEVTNSTPEPDGTNKHYFLRVPPTINTAREAVAWTFGLAANEYEPQVQT